jgi:hypothetical protein
MFLSISSSCEKLTVLNFNDACLREWFPPPMFLLPQGLIGSTLTELKTDVESFYD